MKKLISTLLLSCTLAYGFSQACGNNGGSVCSPDGSLSSPGFADMNTVPCAERQVAYSAVLQFQMFDVFNFLGQQSVDSIEFVSIDNLPCGICWAVNQTDKRYSANEYGCVKFSGTTNDAAGQYKLGLALKAWINGAAQAQNIPASLTDQTGIRLILRVKDNGSSNCPNVDTAANSPLNLTASLSCPVGINEVAKVSLISIVPNPMTSQAAVNLVAAEAGVYTLTVTDMTGKAVETKTVELKTGANTTVIERNNMAAGVYFLQVSDGKNVVTRRFSVSE